MKDSNDYWILKYKSAHWTDEAIARKINSTPEEVAKRWAMMIDTAKSEANNGSLPLSHQFTVMAYQYQLMGESLKIVAGALSNEVSFEEIAALIDGDKAASAERIRTRFIVLRAFQFEDPEKALQDGLRRQVMNS